MIFFFLSAIFRHLWISCLLHISFECSHWTEIVVIVKIFRHRVSVLEDGVLLIWWRLHQKPQAVYGIVIANYDCIMFMLTISRDHHNRNYVNKWRKILMLWNVVGLLLEFWQEAILCCRNSRRIIGRPVQV